jgi:hypothetical protein
MDMSARSKWFLIRSGLLSAVMAGAVLAPASTAMADAKKLSGAGCFFEVESSHSSHDRGNQFRNTSGVTRAVVCPITKEILASTMRVFVRTTSLVGGCQIQRRTGAAFSFFNPQSVLPFGDGTQDVEWTTAIPGNGSYAVRCQVPHNHAILWVQTAEP